MRPVLLYARTLTLIPLLFVLGSCQWLGPRSIKAGMPAYNIAIKETAHETLLLNIVRMRYSETPYFMEISNVYASPSFSAEANAEGTTLSGGRDFGSLGAGLTYSESPTIVYTPVAGEHFVRRLLEPVGLENISLLYQGGWNLERILRLCVQRINNVWNAESATGPTPTMRPPDYAKFQQIARTVDWLENNRLLEIVPGKQGAAGKSGHNAANDREETHIEFVIHPSAKQRPEVRQFFHDLQLDPAAKSYFISKGAQIRDGRTMGIVTRPLIATMFYLSKGVSIPRRDLDGGVVHVTPGEDGRPFDWGLVTAGLFSVESSDKKPDDAYVAVQYRNEWFYLRDSDVISKDTFSLFETLLALRAGAIPESRTPLTLPIR